MSDSNNPYIPVKKLLINNFKSFGKALVEFEKYTVFVTFGDKCVGKLVLFFYRHFDIIFNFQFRVN